MVWTANGHPRIRAQEEAATAGLVVDLQAFSAGAAGELANRMRNEEKLSQTGVLSAFCFALAAHRLDSLPRLLLHLTGKLSLAEGGSLGGLELGRWDHRFTGLHVAIPRSPETNSL